MFRPPETPNTVDFSYTSFTAKEIDDEEKRIREAVDLSFAFVVMNNHVLESFIRAMSATSHMVQLDLQGCNLREKILLVCETLRDHQRLKSLKLSTNEIGSHCTDLCDRLRKIRKLTNVDLSRNGFSNTDCAALSSLIKCHPSLARLDLCANRIDCATSEILSNAATNKKICPLLGKFDLVLS